MLDLILHLSIINYWEISRTFITQTNVLFRKRVPNILFIDQISPYNHPLALYRQLNVYMYILSPCYLRDYAV